MSTTSRALVFKDGSSNKFWNIELLEKSFKVTFGRAGTSGQEQTKSFGSEAEATKAYDKLVAEKLKKGYMDAGGTAAVSPPTPVAKATAKAVGKSKAVVAPEPAVQPKPVSINVNEPRSIALDPVDWFRATFTAHKPLERGTPRPFDQSSCVEKLSKLRTATYGWEVRWADLQLPLALSREEAHFWLTAVTTNRKSTDKVSELAEKIGKKKYDGKVTVDDVVKMCSKQYLRGVDDILPLVLSNLFTVEEYLDLALLEQDTKNRQQTMELETLLLGFAKYVYPFMKEADIAEIRKRLRKTWDATSKPATSYDSYPAEYFLAAIIGMHDEVLAIVSAMDDKQFSQDSWGDHYQRPQDLVMGLGSAELVAGEWRRLRLRMRDAGHVRGFLACTQYSALDCVSESILAETNKEKCEELLKVFTLVRAPEAAEPMLECKLSSKMPGIARDWLDTHIVHAVSGLIHTAASRGKLADAALEYLRNVKRLGHENIIKAQLKTCKEPEVVKKITEEVINHKEKVFEPLTEKDTPAWWKKAFAGPNATNRKLPTWASPALLPPLPVGVSRLNDDQVSILLSLLVTQPLTPTEPHPLLKAVRENVDKHARDAFAWKLFESWQQDGAVNKEKWAMGAMGHIGDDGCASKITPLIRAWPGESQHARAVFGLECLRAIGSDAALMNLSGIAQKLKFKGLKNKAEQFVSEIAKAKGMTRAELEDRIVPECGLDEQGRREFSFGTRSFSFALGGDLKPMLRDADGKLKGDLPKPSSKDDAQVANESIADWKLLKKQIKEVSQIQASRLEQAMVTGRRWKVSDFQTLLVNHPLMIHLVRQLIWGEFNKHGKLGATFRVTEERDYADAGDKAITLNKESLIGLLHPLEIPAEVRAAWGQVLGDYEIVSPFPQMSRAVYPLEAGEAKTDDIKRFHGMKLFAPTLVFTLEKLGWIRGIGMDGGGFDEHSKQFPAADVTAVINYDGTVAMGYILPDEILTVTHCQFIKGMREPSGYGWDKKGTLKLGDISPVVLSEVIADLQVLKSKSK